MADENDDLLNPDEIEALLNSAGGGTPADGPKPSSEAPSSESTPASETEPDPASNVNTVLDSSEIEALLQQRDIGAAVAESEQPSTANAAGTTETEKLLDQAQADLAAAVAPNLGSTRGIPAELGTPAPFQFSEFPDAAANTGGVGLGALQDVELDLHIELGRTELLIEEVLRLKEGSVVPLDKLAGDPVDILVNGRLIARGEVLVLNDNFCVRVAEILTPGL